MNKILYGSTNKAKIKHMKEMLDGMGIEIIGLNDICKKLKKNLPPLVSIYNLSFLIFTYLL